MADLLLGNGYTVDEEQPGPVEVVAPDFTVTVERPAATALTVTPPADLVPVVEAPAVASQSVAVVPVVGPPGPSGGGYAHHQTNPAAQWTIPHGLGYPREPTLLLDTAPTTPVWTDVEHPDTDTTIVIWPEPVTGWAYL